MKAVVLLSGGQDSATTAAIAKSEGHALYALTILYGQRHGREQESAKVVARSLDVREHRFVTVDLRMIGGSALTDEIPVPKDRKMIEISRGIPITYVPARNTIFLALALGYCEVIDGDLIYTGVNALDYSGYPDCRPEFLHAFERLAEVATKAGVQGRRVKIVAPLISMTKAEIVKAGNMLGVDYSLTHSCYDPTPDGLACGRCDACELRLKGFREAGIRDPIEYAPGTKR